PETGNHLLTFSGHAEGVSSLAFAPDDSLLAAGTEDGTIHLWDIVRRKTIATMKGKTGIAKSVAFSLDGRTLAMGGTEKAAQGRNARLSASKRLVVMDRASGDVLWSVDARGSFRHNAICIGGGRLYCIDRLSAGEITRLKRKGLTSSVKSRVVAFDLKT